MLSESQDKYADDLKDTCKQSWGHIETKLGTHSNTVEDKFRKSKGDWPVSWEAHRHDGGHIQV